MPTVNVQLSWLHGDHRHIGLESHFKLLLVLQHLCWMQSCIMQTEMLSPTTYRVTRWVRNETQQCCQPLLTTELCCSTERGCWNPVATSCSMQQVVISQSSQVPLMQVTYLHARSGRDLDQALAVWTRILVAHSPAAVAGKAEPAVCTVLQPLPGLQPATETKAECP